MNVMFVANKFLSLSLSLSWPHHDVHRTHASLSRLTRSVSNSDVSSTYSSAQRTLRMSALVSTTGERMCKVYPKTSCTAAIGDTAFCQITLDLLILDSFSSS